MQIRCLASIDDLHRREGGYVPVRADQLANVLVNVDGIKLICLDACYSDMLAMQLAAHTHVPAIYGIRSLISDESADSFVRGFLTALLSGQTLTAAATQGRLQIDRERPGSREWGLPVLYTATPNDQLVRSLWQMSYTGSVGSNCAKGLVESEPTEPVRSALGTKPSRERQKIETLLTVKRKNLQVLEDQLAASSYAPPEKQAEVTSLRKEISELEAQLVQTT